MTRAEQYRAKAAENETWAERLTDPQLRARYLDLARQYHSMAQQAERDEAQRKGPPPDSKGATGG